MKRIAFLNLFFLAIYFSYGQEKTADKDSFYILSPVEVKAVRASDRAPVTKTNISKKDIEKQNLGQDLPFLLNHTPNVVVNADAGNGVGYTGIRIRGTDATRINVTLNGIPYNDAESQGTFFVDLPDFAVIALGRRRGFIRAMDIGDQAGIGKGKGGRLGVGIRNHHGVTGVTRRLGDVDGLLPAGNDQQRFAHDRTLTGAWKPGGFRAC